MSIFNSQNVLEFSDCFKTDKYYKAYLARIKSKTDYKCARFNHNTYQKLKDFSRQCYICHHIESATANTLFHKVKVGVRRAFLFCFEMASTIKSLSASYMAVRYGVMEKTARFFMLEVREAMASSKNHPIDGDVHVDEFVLGGKDQGKTERSYYGKKKKAITAVQVTKDGKVKRIYSMKIDDFSAQFLQYIFVNHISREAKVTTDKWHWYRPISKGYDIMQIESNKGLNCKALHTMIHQVKSWIRTTYSWVSDAHLNRYFNEFCFRINRLQSKEIIFSQPLKKTI